MEEKITPEIENEEIIDTSEEDEKLEGNKIEELIIAGGDDDADC